MAPKDRRNSFLLMYIVGVSWYGVENPAVLAMFKLGVDRR
jgi:hypothetical protein